MMRVLKFPLLAAAVFLIVAASFARPVAGLWNSPDETANAFWAERVAAGEPLKVRDAVVGLGAGAVHPRSMAVVGDALVPGSFPGIFLLFGAFKTVFRFPVHVYTPLLTLLAGACFGALVARLFDRKTGAVAAALFFLHPAVLYYGTRGLFHNALFADLVILAAASFVLRPLSRAFGARATADDALGGFILAWALVVRTSEAVWVLPAFAAFLPFAGPDRWRRLGAAAAGGLVPLFILMQVNRSLYGSAFRTAYVAPPAATDVAIVAPRTNDSPAEDGDTPSKILPFGLHPRLAARNVWHYGLKLFWWQSLLAVGGFAWWCARLRKASGAQRAYAALSLLVAAWLATLYGSWLVRDRLDPAAVTIGTSYVRYFLPAYLAAIPFAASALVRAADALRRPPVVALGLVLCAVLGVRGAVFAGDESLTAVRSTLAANAEKRALLLDWIEPEAVVMTARHDKLLVPDVLRIIPASDAAAFAAASRALESAPAYWYGLTPAGEEASRIEGLLAAHGLWWYPVLDPAPGETLYEIGVDHGNEEEHGL